MLSDSATLFSQNDVVIEGDLNGPGHTAFGFGTPLAAPRLLIEIDYSNLAGGQQDNIGIDNIRFGQDPPVPVISEIPEPSTVFLLSFGLVAMAAWRRRCSH